MAKFDPLSRITVTFEGLLAMLKKKAEEKEQTILPPEAKNYINPNFRNRKYSMCCFGTDCRSVFLFFSFLSFLSR